MSVGIVEHSILQYVLQYGFAVLQYIAIRFLPYCCTPSNWCSYFDGMSPFPGKFVIPIILENFDPQSFLLPEFDMHLLKSATLLFG